MIEVDIPGKGFFHFEHLVCDVNGTLALDGNLLDGVAAAFEELRHKMTIHLVTANTHGRQEVLDRQLKLSATILQPGGESLQKASYVEKLGVDSVVAIGQGANDAEMLREAALGICVLSQEGVAIDTLLAADILVPDILAALKLLENPRRIVATLRK